MYGSILLTANSWPRVLPPVGHKKTGNQRPVGCAEDETTFFDWRYDRYDSRARVVLPFTGIARV